MRSLVQIQVGPLQTFTVYPDTATRPRRRVPDRHPRGRHRYRHGPTRGDTTGTLGSNPGGPTQDPHQLSGDRDPPSLASSRTSPTRLAPVPPRTYPRGHDRHSGLKSRWAHFRPSPSTRAPRPALVAACPIVTREVGTGTASGPTRGDTSRRSRFKSRWAHPRPSPSTRAPRPTLVAACLIVTREVGTGTATDLPAVTIPTQSVRGPHYGTCVRACRVRQGGSRLVVLRDTQDHTDSPRTVTE